MVAGVPLVRKKGNIMKKFCDLHTHSVFSDGTYKPAEIIDSAVDIGLSAVALCDHNTVDGLPQFLSAASGKNIKAIAGAEFSVDYEGTELHILGLYLPEKYFSEISELMAEVNRRKEQSNIALIESLNRAGYLIDYDTIKNQTPNGKFNRAHIAAQLTSKGYTSSIKEAFETLLSKTAGHYFEPKRLTVWEALDLIKSVNAVPVLAHPLLNLDKGDLEVFLSKAVRRGLIGMECYYSTYDEEKTKYSLDVADRFGLCYSGGSDFHGDNKPDIKLGIGKGNLAVPYKCVTLLEKAKAR